MAKTDESMAIIKPLLSSLLENTDTRRSRVSIKLITSRHLCICQIWRDTNIFAYWYYQTEGWNLCPQVKSTQLDKCLLGVGGDWAKQACYFKVFLFILTKHQGFLEELRRTPHFQSIWKLVPPYQLSLATIVLHNNLYTSIASRIKHLLLSCLGLSTRMALLMVLPRLSHMLGPMRLCPTPPIRLGQYCSHGSVLSKWTYGKHDAFWDPGSDIACCHFYIPWAKAIHRICPHSKEVDSSYWRKCSLRAKGVDTGTG